MLFLPGISKPAAPRNFNPAFPGLPSAACSLPTPVSVSPLTACSLPTPVSASPLAACPLPTPVSASPLAACSLPTPVSVSPSAIRTLPSEHAPVFRPAYCSLPAPASLSATAAAFPLETAHFPSSTAPGSIAIVLYTESPINRAVPAINRFSTASEPLSSP